MYRNTAKLVVWMLFIAMGLVALIGLLDRGSALGVALVWAGGFTLFGFIITRYVDIAADFIDEQTERQEQ
ncbi:hypothetical protein PENTCL1PPCAC_248, partial [Pristionchus entomophagus]